MASFQKTIAFLCVLFMVSPGQCQEYVSYPPYNVPVGGGFSLDCDARRVTLPRTASDSIRLLEVYKLRPSTDLLIFKMQPVLDMPHDPMHAIIRKNRPGRHWEMSYEGYTEGQPANRDSLIIKMHVRHARCEDAGTYECVVSFYKTSRTFDTLRARQEVVVTGEGCAKPLI